MCGFIAGATTKGALDARAIVVNMSSPIPDANRFSVLAVAGAITMAAACRAQSM
jgi:hypothetical protein